MSSYFPTDPIYHWTACIHRNRRRRFVIDIFHNRNDLSCSLWMSAGLRAPLCLTYLRQHADTTACHLYADKVHNTTNIHGFIAFDSFSVCRPFCICFGHLQFTEPFASFQQFCDSDLAASSNTECRESRSMDICHCFNVLLFPNTFPILPFHRWTITMWLRLYSCRCWHRYSTLAADSLCVNEPAEYQRNRVRPKREDSTVCHLEVRPSKPRRFSTNSQSQSRHTLSFNAKLLTAFPSNSITTELRSEGLSQCIPTGNWWSASSWWFANGFTASTLWMVWRSDGRSEWDWVQSDSVMEYVRTVNVEPNVSDVDRDLLWNSVTLKLGHRASNLTLSLNRKALIGLPKYSFLVHWNMHRQTRKMDTLCEPL